LPTRGRVSIACALQDKCRMLGSVPAATQSFISYTVIR